MDSVHGIGRNWPCVKSEIGAMYFVNVQYAWYRICSFDYSWLRTLIYLWFKYVVLCCFINRESTIYNDYSLIILEYRMTIRFSSWKFRKIPIITIVLKRLKNRYLPDRRVRERTLEKLWRKNSGAMEIFITTLEVGSFFNSLRSNIFSFVKIRFERIYVRWIFEA